MESDILQPLPVRKWPLLLDLLKKDWPNYACYYFWMKNSIKWKENDPTLKLEIFCPRNEYYSGIFIGIASHSPYTIVFAFDGYQDLLLKVLKMTRVINWNDRITFDAVHQYNKEIILNFVRDKGYDKGIELDYIVDSYTYFKRKEECVKIEVKVPNECELRYLDESHVSLVHSLWPYRDVEKPDRSIRYLKTIVKMNRSIGLFLKEDGALVSWVLNCDWSGLGSLQTLPTYKRRGYAKIVAQALAKDLAENDNLDSILFISKGNIASEKLFESLGYTHLPSATWIFTKLIEKC